MDDASLTGVLKDLDPTARDQLRLLLAILQALMMVGLPDS